MKNLYDPARLAELKSFELMDSEEDEHLDNITRLASYICKTPISLVTLLDEKRQFFKSKVGLDIKETPIEQSFCIYSIESENAEPFIVKDARKDKRFTENPLVTSEPRIVFYAAVPLITDNNLPLGTLCVIDQVPRQLDSDQLDALKALSKQVIQFFELKKSEQKLCTSNKIIQEQHQRIQNIVSATKVGTWEWNYQTGELIVNDRWVDMLGYKRAELEPITIDTFNSMVFSEDFQLTQDNLKEISKKGHSYFDIEYRMIHKSGKVVWINDRGKVLSRNVSGEPEIIAGTQTDISGKKEAELTILQSEQRFKSLVQDGGDLIATLDLEGNYSYVSSSAKNILGFEPAYFIGKTAFDLIHGEDVELVLEQFQQLSHQRRLEIAPYRFQNSEGDWRWLETTVTNLLDDPSVKGIVANSRDVSDKIFYKKELEKSEKLHRALVENGADALTVINLEGQATYVSPSIQKVLGYTEAEALELNLFDITHSDDLESVTAKLEEVLRYPGIPIPGVTARAKHKDGSWRWLEATITNLLHDPVINGIVDNFRDVTEQVETNRKIKQSEKRFKAMVQESADLISILSLDGTYQYLSPNYVDYLGFKENELLGQNAFNFIHPDDRDLTLDEFSQIAHQKQVKSSPYRFMNKKLGWRWLQSIGTNLLDDPSVEGIVVNSMDLTDVITIQNKLRESNERFELVMKAGSESIWDYNPATKELYLSEAFARTYGVEISDGKSNNAKINELMHPEERDLVLKSFQKAIADSFIDTWSNEYRLRQADGTYCHVKDKSIILRDQNGKAYRVVGAIKDVTKEYFYQRLEAIEKSVMEQSISQDSVLKDILNYYLLELEEIFPEMRASLMCVKDNRIYDLASPSLPKSFIKKFSGSVIGPKAASCGTAAYTKNKVIVEDVRTDERWEGYRELALNQNFLACWSIPILDEGGKVVATFANYFEQPRVPQEFEEQAIDRAQRLISILLTKYEYLDKIQKNNERFSLINKATNDAIFDWDILKDQFQWGDGFYRIFGHQKHEGNFTLADWTALMNPQDSEQGISRWEKFLEDKKQLKWANEFRFKKGDGSYAFVEELGYLIRDQEGKPVRMIGVLRDKSEAKAEEIKRELQREVSTYFKGSNNLIEILDQVVEYLGKFSESNIAEIWLTGFDNMQLNLATHYVQDPKIEKIYQKETKKSFIKGEGLPGTAWKTGTSIHLKEIQENENFTRKSLSKAAKLNSGIGIPLFHNQDVIGVLVFSLACTDLDETSQVFFMNSLKNYLGAEIKRKQQEEELYQFFDSAPEILAIASPKGNFSKVNPAFCKLLGYTVEELTGRPFSEFLHPEDLIQTKGEFDEMITGERKAVNFVNRYRSKSGTYKWISWNSSEIFGQNGFVFAYGRDVTQFKELQTLLDNANKLAKVGGWEIDLKDNTLYWSAITREIHELPLDYVPDLKEGIDFYRADKRDIVKEIIDEAISTGKSFDFEMPIVTAKGNERWVRVIGEGEFEGDKCVRIFGSFQDINERKNLELRLKNVSDNIPGVIFQYNLFPDGTDKFKFVSEGSRNLWGLSPQECEADSSRVWDLVKAGGDYEEVQQSVVESVTTLNRWHAKWRIKTPDGKITWQEGFGTPVRLADGTIISDSLVMDITEKKGLEDLIQRSNEMARIGNWEVDLVKNANSIYWSKMTQEIVEAEGVQNLSLDEAIQYYQGESKELIKNVMLDLIKYDRDFDVEVLLKTFKGNLRWIRILGQGERIDGRCIRIYGSFQDIHDRKVAELEFKSLFEEKNSILESIGDGFFTLDKDFTVTYWNRMAEKLLRTPKEIILGKNLWKVFNDALDLDSFKNYNQVLVDGVAKHFEDYYESLDSWFSISAYPSGSGLSVYFKDITDKKRSEEQIKLSNERFEKVVEATNDAIWDYNLAEDRLYWGKGFKKLFGYDPDIFKPSFEKLIGLIHPEEREEVRAKMLKVMSDPKLSNWTEEYRFLKSNGEYAYAMDRATFIRNEKGEPVRAIGAMSDISHRKEYEESLRNLNIDLEQYSKELAISNAELEQFAYVASHDLQEPLRMITSFMNQLERKYEDKLDDRAQKYIHFAVDGAQRMRQIILDLLEYSRVGKQYESMELVDLNDVVQETLILQRKRIEEKSAKIEVGPLPKLQSFRSPLTQIFQNLIGNALKYTKEGVSPKINISAVEQKTYWEFAVSDNGLGIHEDYFEKIFIIFQRLHGKSEFEGTGMGLTIVKKILESMGGSIWVESKSGKGSTFYFTLPKKE